jgi:hypothetical protein
VLSIAKLMPLVKEANLIASELKRSMSLRLNPTKQLPDWMGKNISSDLKRADLLWRVQVANHELGNHYSWDEDKFLTRLEVMRDLVNTYFDEGTIPVDKSTTGRSGHRRTTRTGARRRRI